MPPFDQVKVEHFEPALEAGMADQLAKIARITAETAPTTFENTIAALERSDRLLKQVVSVCASPGSTTPFSSGGRGEGLA